MSCFPEVSFLLNTKEIHGCFTCKSQAMGLKNEIDTSSAKSKIRHLQVLNKICKSLKTVLSFPESQKTQQFLNYAADEDFLKTIRFHIYNSRLIWLVAWKSITQRTACIIETTFGIMCCGLWALNTISMFDGCWRRKTHNIHYLVVDYWCLVWWRQDWCLEVDKWLGIQGL